MTDRDSAEPGFDPRFDPAFQPGYDPLVHQQAVGVFPEATGRRRRRRTGQDDPPLSFRGRRLELLPRHIGPPGSGERPTAR